MRTFDYSELGQRIKTLRRGKRLSQQALADLLGKSLRTVQKYETGEIEVSIAMVYQLAEILDTSPLFLIGYEMEPAPMQSMADVMRLLFQLDELAELDFQIEVKKPPEHKGWTCSLSFDGKNPCASQNADLCLFLDHWRDMRDGFRNCLYGNAEYHGWQERIAGYYASEAVTPRVYEKVDPEECEQRKMAYLETRMPKP